MTSPSFISLHGGHSGQFCCHAVDRLEEIVCAYIEQGFKRVGITEHIPPVIDLMRYPDEIKQELTARDLYQRFARYITEVKRLKAVYQSKIHIHAGMETETYTGYLPHVKQLIQEFKPDYIVGSVHHVDDISFDYSRQEYDRAVRHCGSHEQLYLRYFDLQFEMINTLHPFVVGHFDLIRIHDIEGYKQRLLSPVIQEKILRNLHLIKALGLVMDFNLRPLTRGEKEPYLTPSLLKMIKTLGIPVVPGDDSHGQDQAGGHVAHAIEILETMGFDTRWPEPKLLPLNN
jgi:histidinol-phosphatase (PHP family)